MAAEEVKSEQHLSDVPITHRTIAIRDDTVDPLLVVFCDIPSNATIQQAARALISKAAEFLEDITLGASILDTEGGRVIVHSRSDDKIGEQPTTGARMFPKFAYEHTVLIGLDDGSMLHVAADDDDLFGQAPVQALLTRLALTLGAAVRRCRAYVRAQKLTEEVENLKAQIGQADKLASIGQMVASVVHEINNPLTSIVAISDFLRKKVDNSGMEPADIERLYRIMEAAERILEFSRNLTEYAAPPKRNIEPVAIHAVIDRALVFCAHEIEQSNIEVRREYAASTTVQGVVGQLTQVFVNLFTNAAHAMRRDGGRLTITTELTPGGDWVHIAVYDEGYGIAEEHLPYIFDPFFTTKTDGTGTGLGLNIVRNIVVEHQGRIRVASRSPKGVAFYIELPVVTPPGAPR